MGSKTVYTSSVSVPIYASWKCEHCGEVNFATGAIVCQRQESTSSWRSSKQREVKERVANLVEAEWAGEAYEIISDPNHNGSAMYSKFFLENTNCTNCGKKPRWDKHAKFLSLLGLCVPAGIISGIAAFSMLTSIGAWLIFLACVAFIVWGVAREEVYKKMMPKLPTKYTPVIGSQNAELIAYADELGETIPSPDKCIAIVKGYDHAGTVSTPTVQPAVQSNFCRMCGARLPAHSDICHLCGKKTKK